MTTEEIKNRKGARKIQDIPKEVLVLLNKGEIETANLTEWLAIDQLQLIGNTFTALGLKESIPTLKEGISKLKNASTMQSIKSVGESLYQFYSNKSIFNSVIEKLSNHPSDTVRCYAPYLISFNEKLTIEEKLTSSLPLIADKHFGIREIVWMALRPEIEKELEKAIQILNNWTSNKDENIRRFCTEVIRPRGVWCKHLESLKNEPQQALVILEKLKSDPAKYVQDSVGNWLNDASKSRPEFVVDLCKKWKKDAPSKDTAKIIKRALRTINKK